MSYLINTSLISSSMHYFLMPYHSSFHSLSLIGMCFLTFNLSHHTTLHDMITGIVYKSKDEKAYRNLVDICFAFMKHDGYKAGQLMIDGSRHTETKVARHPIKTPYQYTLECPIAYSLMQFLTHSLTHSLIALANKTSHTPTSIYYTHVVPSSHPSH